MSERTDYIDYGAYSVLAIDRPVDGVLRVVLNQPAKLNACDHPTHRELIDVLHRIDGDPSVNAVLLTGAGRAFSAGGDLAMLLRNTHDWEAFTEQWRLARDLVYGMIQCGKPIVTAIRGPAVGAGLSVALLADVPVVSKSARLLDGHTRIGVSAGGHASMIWPILCGMARTKHHLLLNDPIDGETAARIGLAALCVEDEALAETALGIAARLARGAPAAIRWTKFALNNWLRLAGPIFDASLAIEMMGMRGPDFLEGLAAVRERRAPRYATRSSV
jgi:enoyl-CoA hydratase